MKRRQPRAALDVQGLSGRDDLFRLAGAAKRDPGVAAWFANDTTGLRALAQPWFARMRACGDDVRELMHDGCPVACVDDAPFGYVNAFTNHASVGFFRGVLLADPARLLEGTGKRMRHVKLVPGRDANDAELRNLVDAAYADIGTRLAVERGRKG